MLCNFLQFNKDVNNLELCDWMFLTEMHLGSCSRPHRLVVPQIFFSALMILHLSSPNSVIWILMMEVSGAPADVLLQRPWLPVSISGCQLLAKIWFGDSAYHILLTDMICVWEERMDSAAIQRRAQVRRRQRRGLSS